jgi:hypothetical protein
MKVKKKFSTGNTGSKSLHYRVLILSSPVFPVPPVEFLLLFSFSFAETAP